MSSKRYQLTLTRDQAALVRAALDMYFRVGMGQLRDVVEHLLDPKLPIDEWCKRRDLIDSVMLAARSLARPELPSNAYHSISSDKISENNRIACDIHDVIRHHLAMEASPNGWTVAHDEPRKLSDEPLPDIKTIEE